VEVTVDGFLDFFWLMLWFFLWIIWIWLLIRVFGDIFRADMSGWAKAGWMVFILILPFLGVFIYLITNGGDMGRREVERIQAIDQAQRDYIRDAAGTSGGVADELEKLAGLKDRGVISDAEFENQKSKLLA
jgi:hypothetical protein